MSIYTNVLVAVDLRVTHDVYTIERAIELSKKLKCQSLRFIHVMEPLYGYGAIEGNTLVELEMKIATDARQSFYDLVSRYDITQEQLIIETGNPKVVIVDQAKALDIDLLIVGGHALSGLRTIVGSTATGVINHAHCDVLTIRTAN
ncbi:MAG: universal stress protein [Candidatus Berkiella sp.]